MVRVVDSRGRPRRGWQGWLLFRVEPAGRPRQRGGGFRKPSLGDWQKGYWADPLHYRDGRTADDNGVVRLPALVPGVPYALECYDARTRRWRVGPEFRVKPGEVLRLPDLTVKEEAPPS